MRNLLLASIFGVLAVSTAAQAADMPSYPAEQAAVVAGHDWSGMYVGINGGWNWGETDDDGAIGDFDDLEGFVIGGHVGYNWQMDSGLVFGVEADGNYVDNDEDDGVAAIEQNYLASFRGRLGFGFDNFLVYGTGGIGFSGVDTTVGIVDDDADYFGWVAGGGVEYMLTENVTLGVEYLHYEFDEEPFDDAAAGGDLGLNNNVVRGRLSVKFDSLFN